MKKNAQFKYLAIITLFVLAVAACSPGTVNESNIIAKLFSLSKYSLGDIDGYLKGLNFKPGKAKTIAATKYQMDILTYSSTATTSNYFVDIVQGKTFAVGYTTYSEDEYQNALKTMSDSGFVQKSVINADSTKSTSKFITKTTYSKQATGDRVVIMTKKGRKGIYYSLQANNEKESAKLLNN